MPRVPKILYLWVWAAVVLREAPQTFAGVAVALVHADQVGGARVGLTQVELRRKRGEKGEASEGFSDSNSS